MWTSWEKGAETIDVWSGQKEERRREGHER